MTEHEHTIAILILTLKQIKGIGNKAVIRILQRNKVKIVKVEAVDVKFLETLDMLNYLSKSDMNENDWDQFLKVSHQVVNTSISNGIQIIHCYMKDYPARLMVNRSKPALLFCKGDVSLLSSEKNVAIVGTRHPDSYSFKYGVRLAERLASKGYVIVSGLAIGCDSAAHQGALNVSGKTIAVLPTPLDGEIYPKANRDLAEEILVKGGLLVSEYPSGIPLKEYDLISNLKARNEWQVGLSNGVVVVEAKSKSGTRGAMRFATNSGTPLAVIDYEPHFGADFLSEDRYSANVEYIRNNLADSIFEWNAVEAFMLKMQGYYTNLVKESRNSLDAETFEDMTQFQQIKFENM